MLTLEKAESIQDSLIVSLWVFVAGLIWSIIVVVISLFLWNNTDIFAGFLVLDLEQMLKLYIQ